MNLPNKLTMFRIILIPVLIITYLLIDLLGPKTYWIMGIIFVIAALTDYFDGSIARKRGIVTTFGKFIDPLADKLLVISVLLVLADNFKTVSTMWMPFWIPLIIIARELIVTSIRLIAVGEGKVIAASNLGKSKTAMTMLAITYYLFAMPLTIPLIQYIGYVLIGLSVFLTILSGLDYLLKNRKIIFASV